VFSLSKNPTDAPIQHACHPNSAFSRLLLPASCLNFTTMMIGFWKSQKFDIDFIDGNGRSH
jgi:hypothetical protein